MKRFKFRLESLLKVRKSKEKIVKIELGAIVKQIQENKNEIEKLNSDINFAYKNQESMQNQIFDAKFLEFYPYYIQGKKLYIEELKKKIEDLQLDYNEKVEELNSARADSKLIEQLKEKDQVKYKKTREKLFQNEIDEMSIMRRHLKEEII